MAVAHMFKSAIIVFFTAVFTLVLGGEAWAWGPGVHMFMGNHVLNSLDLICPAVAELLFVHGNSFLYGSLCPDVFIGKGSRYKPLHSHNWSTGFTLLESADAPQLKAYSYGYLTHLAADVVAHNFYVPNVLVLKRLGGKFSHVLLELQADMNVKWDIAKAQEILARPYRHHEHRLLTSMNLTGRLPFLLKKELFKSGMYFGDRNSWNGLGAFIDLVLPYEEDGKYLQTMIDLTLRVVMNFLKDPEASPVLMFDPIGGRRLRFVKRLRRLRKKEGEPGTQVPVFPVDACLQNL